MAVKGIDHEERKGIIKIIYPQEKKTYMRRGGNSHQFPVGTAAVFPSKKAKTTELGLKDRIYYTTQSSLSSIPLLDCFFDRSLYFYFYLSITSISFILLFVFPYAIMVPCVLYSHFYRHVSPCAVTVFLYRSIHAILQLVSNQSLPTVDSISSSSCSL